MERLNTLQGLRAVAFLAIFISHSGISNTSQMGAWGVSVFFALSGFLMMYNYMPRREIPKLGFRFVWLKIKRLYPLHIAVMLGMAVYDLVLNNDIAKTVVDMVLQSTLTHIWIPIPGFYKILNTVSWYLAACAFIYFMFPLVLKLFKKIKSNKTGIYLLILFFAIQVLISVFAFYFGNIDKSKNFSMQWITYYFPVSRLVDFILGCSLGYLFLNKKKFKSAYFYHIVAAVAFVLAGVSVYLSATKQTFLSAEQIRYTLLYTPTTLMILWTLSCAEASGNASKLLTSKLMVSWGG